jgi:hypothetical protein
MYFNSGSYENWPRNVVYSVLQPASIIRMKILYCMYSTVEKCCLILFLRRISFLGNKLEFLHCNSRLAMDL